LNLIDRACKLVPGLLSPNTLALLSSPFILRTGRSVVVSVGSGLMAMVLALLMSSAAVAQSAGSVVEVTLQPGDLLRIDIWREPDLSGEFLIDPDGQVVLPLLGEQRVARVPMRQVREMLMEGYRLHLRNPSINILPLRRIHVLGEVNRPGLYQVDPTISLAAAVALAGGANATGDLQRIRIVRDGEVLRERVGASDMLEAVDIRSGDQILVDRRSWFERNSTFLISVGLSLPSVVAAVLALANR
jgi:protein involved in polysaccharide export with SLBB domain